MRPSATPRTAFTSLLLVSQLPVAAGAALPEHAASTIAMAAARTFTTGKIHDPFGVREALLLGLAVHERLARLDLVHLPQEPTFGSLLPRLALRHRRAHLVD